MLSSLLPYQLLLVNLSGYHGALLPLLIEINMLAKFSEGQPPKVFPTQRGFHFGYTNDHPEPFLRRAWSIFTQTNLQNSGIFTKF